MLVLRRFAATLFDLALLVGALLACWWFNDEAPRELGQALVALGVAPRAIEFYTAAPLSRSRR